MTFKFVLVFSALMFSLALPARAEVNNLKIVTDASPDYSDMDSLIHSVTAKGNITEDKLWSLFYWNHIARRQTSPMNVHGTALTDPIRQFNDYGFTMCSTISGINCSIWDAMGLPVKYWDISNHTVAEVFYDNRWHMYDNSMSALYTLCDGKTIAGVEDIGKEGACAVSGGKTEKGHVALYHSLTATSPNGFLTGADTIRSLDEESRCFNPNALKYRSYFYDWDKGHRYILNLHDGEVYTRFYKSLGEAPQYFVPNNGKDPEAVSNFKIRGNGMRIFTPNLARLDKIAHSFSDVRFDANGVTPQGNGEVVFKIEGANVITNLKINAAFSQAQNNAISISTTNGLQWQEVAKNQTAANLNLTSEVNGAYEVLVKISLSGQTALKSISFDTHNNAQRQNAAATEHRQKHDLRRRGRANQQQCALAGVAKRQSQTAHCRAEKRAFRQRKSRLYGHALRRKTKRRSLCRFQNGRAARHHQIHLRRAPL